MRSWQTTETLDGGIGARLAKSVQYSTLGVAAMMPVPFIAGYELQDKCDIPVPEEHRNVNACAPDSVDAAMVAAGGVICAMGGALYWRRKEAEAALQE